MREIKFRARALDREYGLIYFGLDEIGLFDHGCGVFYAKDIPCEIDSIQQFTGLHAKNGEIYEGDVVKYEKHEGYLLPDSVGEVIWKDVGYSISDPKGRTHDVDLWEADELEDDLLNHIEILGNIYENPELITPN